MLNITNCPVCNNPGQAHFLTCEDYTVSHERFNIVSCTDCGFKFTNPIPDPNDLGSYYKSEDYISHSETRKDLVSRAYHLVRNYTLSKKLKLISKYASKGIILDYGAGTGRFLAHCKTAGWTVNGIEPDEGARKIARGEGIVLWPDLNSSPKETSIKYDVITLWHVLEHVADLNPTLTFLKGKLKAGGTLFIAVPNHLSDDAQYYGEHWAAYDVPRHLYHFDPDSIKRLLASHQLSLIETLPMKFDSYYVSLLSEKYKTGKTRYAPAVRRGWISNLKAAATGNYSSLIYIFRHN
jgi:2-polyprenyl-3-methyl-5-hydroxy-6-metoxy-1,4-benzoquinol methylase